jgi:hypothetical protein
MANPTLLYGAIDISTAQIFSTASNPTTFIRCTGDFTSGSPIINNVGDSGTFKGLDFVFPGMMLRSPGELTGYVEIDSVDTVNNTITLTSNADATNSGQLFLITPPAGMVYISGSTFSKVGGSIDNPPNNFNDVTGSEDADYDSDELPWAVIAQLAITSSVAGGLTGLYGAYELTRITNRTSTQTVDMYISASETIDAFKETPGYTVGTAQSKLMLVQRTGSFMPIAGATALGSNQDLGLASYNALIGSTFANLSSGSSGGGFPYSGSAEITGSLAVTGSSEFTIPVGGNNDNFFIKSGSAIDDPRVFNVDGEGTIQFFAQDNSYEPTPILGGLYFTSASAFIGTE